MDILKRIYGLIKPYKGKLIVAMLLHTGIALSRLLAPILTRSVINDVIPQKDLYLLGWLCAGLIGLAAVRGVGNYIRTIIMERVSQSAVFDLRVGLYKHLQELPYGFYDNHRVGEIMSRMTGDIEGIRNLIAGGLSTVFDNLTSFVGALIFLTILSPMLMLSLLAFAPVIAIVAWVFRKKIRPAFTATREQNAVLNTRTQENISGIRVVKAFAREPYEFDKFVQDNRKLLSDHLRATWIWSDFVPVMELLSSLCTPVMLIVGSYLVLHNDMDLGTLIAVNGYVWLITNPMRMLANIVNMLTQAVTSAEKLFYYVDFGSSIKEPEDAETPKEYRGKVEFDDVTFSYGGEDVLKNISFTAEPGQTVAIMGATGTGKTSLTLLLGRFYDVRSGSVKIDGIDVRKHKLEQLRRQIAYVPQETFLFSDTLEDNIRFGRPDEEHSAVEAAAQVSQAVEFIGHMPQGYDTIVGERGVGLSGGQKQRVAIARAVLTDPSVLIMDDSTSAVDMETEYEIQNALKEVLNGRTTFIIAHRISSVKRADLILVLKDGRICERGNHKSLIEQKGEYYNMVREQYRDFDAFAKKGGAN